MAANNAKNHTNMTTHIIVADDHPLFRSAINLLLQRLSIKIKVTEVEDFKSLISLLKSSESLASLVLLDLKLPDTQGIDGLLVLKKSFPALPVAIVSAYDDQKIIQSAMQYGASGFISKSLDMAEMGQAIEKILEGDLWFPQINTDTPSSHLAFDELTNSQLKVLALLREGKPSKEMASLINVTEATIKAHLTVIYRKLNVTNRTQAVIAAKQLDLPEFNVGNR